MGEEGLIKDWSNSFINFGILRLFGKIGKGQNPILHHFIQDSGMVLGQNMAYHFDITSKPQGKLLQQFVHAEAVNLQMTAGISLAHFTTGGRLSQIERNLDLEIEANTFASRNNQNPLAPSFHSTFETQAQSILYSTTPERIGGGRSYPQTNLELSFEELRQILGRYSIIGPKETLENASTRGKLLAAAARSVYLLHPSSDRQSALLQIHRIVELSYARLDFEMLKAYRDELDPETERYFNRLIPLANKSANPEDRLFSLDEMELDLPGARVVPRIDHIRINFTTQFEGNTSRTVPDTRDLLTSESSKLMALAFINTFKNRMSALKLSLHILRKISQLPTLPEMIHQGSADDRMKRALATILKVLQEATEYKRILLEDKGLYHETFLQNVFFYDGYNLQSDYLLFYQTILELNPELRQREGIEEMPTFEEIISQIPEQKRKTPQIKAE